MSIDSGLWAALAVVLPLLVAAPFIALAGYVVVRLLGNSARNRALLATGESALAIILAADDTGVTVNDSPQVRLTLEVRPDRMQPYQAQTTLLVGRLQIGMLTPGMPVRVKFDPADPSRVAVESLGGPAPTYGGPTSTCGGGGGDAAPLGTVARQMQEDLLSRERTCEQLRRTGEGAPARVLNLADTGIRIGDGASMLRFGLEVLPTGRPAFRAETQCAVSDASRTKFAPGSTVHHLPSGRPVHLFR